MTKCIVRFFFVFLVSLSSYSQLPEKQIRAFVALMHKDTTKVLELLKDTLSTNPNQPVMIKTVGELYYKRKDYANAIRYYLKGLTYDSSLSLQLSLSYAQIKHTDSTLFWLQEYLKTRTKMPENKLKTLSEYAFLQNHSAWNNLWKKEWYNDYEQRLGEIQYLFEQKQINELMETIQSAKSLYKHDIQLILWEARAFWLGENPRQALKSLQSLLTIQPYNQEALLLKAEIFEKQLNHNKLAETYEDLFKAQPYFIYWKYLASLNFNIAYKYKEALENLKFYFLYDTLLSKAYYQAGIAAKNLKKHQEAIDYLTRSIKLDGSNSEAFYERGCCHYELNNLERAFSDLCMAMDLKPMQGKYFYQRGLINYALNRSLAACRDFERAKQYGYIKAESYIQRYCRGKN